MESSIRIDLHADLTLFRVRALKLERRQRLSTATSATRGCFSVCVCVLAMPNGFDRKQL